jgi:hypothetical protein
MKVIGAGSKGLARAWRRAAVARLRGPALFAQALLRRHAQRSARMAGLELLLAQRLAPQPLAVHRHAGNTVNRWSVTMQTVLQRVEQVAQRAEHASTPSGMPAMPLGSRAAAPANAAQREPAHHQAAGGNTMLRLVARASRVETTAPSPAPTLRPTSLAASPDAPRGVMAAPLPQDLPAVRAPTAARNLGRASQTSDAQAGTETATPAARTQPVAVGQPLPQHEIERIAEQVIGSIDRRIVAERERRGRF